MSQNTNQPLLMSKDVSTKHIPYINPKFPIELAYQTSLQLASPCELYLHPDTQPMATVQIISALKPGITLHVPGNINSQSAGFIASILPSGVCIVLRNDMTLECIKQICENLKHGTCLYISENLKLEFASQALSYIKNNLFIIFDSQVNALQAHRLAFYIQAGNTLVLNPKTPHKQQLAMIRQLKPGVIIGLNNIHSESSISEILEITPIGTIIALPAHLEFSQINALIQHANHKHLLKCHAQMDLNILKSFIRALNREIGIYFAADIQPNLGLEILKLLQPGNKLCLEPKMPHFTAISLALNLPRPCFVYCLPNTPTPLIEEIKLHIGHQNLQFIEEPNPITHPKLNDAILGLLSFSPLATSDSSEEGLSPQLR
jgi:hypothetical protein